MSEAGQLPSISGIVNKQGGIFSLHLSGRRSSLAKPSTYDTSLKVNRYNAQRPLSLNKQLMNSTFSSFSGRWTIPPQGSCLSGRHAEQENLVSHAEKVQHQLSVLQMKMDPFQQIYKEYKQQIKAIMLKGQKLILDVEISTHESIKKMRKMLSDLRRQSGCQQKTNKMELSSLSDELIDCCNVYQVVDAHSKKVKHSITPE